MPEVREQVHACGGRVDEGGGAAVARFSAGSVPGADAARVTFAKGLAAGWTHMRRAETGRDHNRHPADREARLEAFVGQAVVDMGAAISGLLLHIDDRLGLYKAMAGAGPITSATLAARTGTTERYVREWLGNQAAGGYVVYNPVDGTFELPAEQAMVVANEDTRSASAGPSRASQRVTTTTSWSTGSAPGRGSAGRSMTTGCFSGVLWLFRPGFAAHRVDEWLPALDGGG